LALYLAFSKRLVWLMRRTPLHPVISFLHVDTVLRRNTLALDITEPFKPFFAERLLSRTAVSAGQYRSLTSELTTHIGIRFDSVRIYTTRAADSTGKHTIGVGLAETGLVL